MRRADDKPLGDDDRRLQPDDEQLDLVVQVHLLRAVLPPLPPATIMVMKIDDEKLAPN